MLGKVGDLYITRYINPMAKSTVRARAKFAVIPDLHAVNYPQRMRRVSDSGATVSVEAVISRLRLTVRAREEVPKIISKHKTKPKKNVDKNCTRSCWGCIK